MYLLFCIHLLFYASIYSFDNLRIRRLKKTESTTKGASSLSKPKGRCKHDEKQAHLMFTATIKTDSKTIVLKALSQPIYLSKLLSNSRSLIIQFSLFIDANHDPPEIHRVVPQFGTTGDYVALIGTRMHSRKCQYNHNNKYKCTFQSVGNPNIRTI